MYIKLPKMFISSTISLYCGLYLYSDSDIMKKI